MKVFLLKKDKELDEFLNNLLECQDTKTFLTKKSIMDLSPKSKEIFNKDIVC